MRLIGLRPQDCSEHAARTAVHAPQVDDVIAEIRARPDILNELLVHLIDIAKNDQGASKSWPTLLKSQPFFERVATFLKGRASV